MGLFVAPLGTPVGLFIAPGGTPVIVELFVAPGGTFMVEELVSSSLFSYKTFPTKNILKID